jgi:hypothetical protein
MMTDRIILTLPEDISDRAREIAESKAQSVEQILLDHLQTLSISLPTLPPDIETELEALRNLSDDALWTIAREQMPDDVQTRAHELMDKNARAILGADESAELEHLVERADRLMLRKAEAASLLKARGYSFTQKDFKPPHE